MGLLDDTREREGQGPDIVLGQSSLQYLPGH